MDYKKRPDKYWRFYLIASVLTVFLFFSLVSLKSETPFPSASSSEVSLYANQLDDNLTDLFTSAIDKAEDSVLLIVYSLTDKKIIDSLKNISKKGVAVRVICDAKTSPNVNFKLGSKIETLQRFSTGLMHQKILVIDRRKIWIGSANMTLESLKLHGNLVSEINDESLASYLISKAHTMKLEGLTQPIQKKDFIFDTQKIEMWFLPDNKEAPLYLKNLIDSAKKTLKIAMFTWTRNDLAEAVIKASKRGVKTEVAIDNCSGKGASAKIVTLLKDNKIDIVLSRGGPLLHHKFLYIDEAILVNGSANWTKAAFTKNDDCFMVIHPLTQQQIEKMEALWKVIKRDSIKP